jgi:hypothetical protein
LGCIQRFILLQGKIPLDLKKLITWVLWTRRYGVGRDVAVLHWQRYVSVDHTQGSFPGDPKRGHDLWTGMWG